MKKLVYILLVIITLVSCSDDDTEDADLIGNWKLIEVLSDPGDGNGTFQDIDSEKTITFFEDGTFSSTESICNSATTDDLYIGVYTDSNLTPDNCSDSGWAYNFVIDGNTLILSYPCIEPCKEKYIKL
ncbi:hypothetical protein HNV08_15695 [Winogradskyella eckloniae]|uniref:hypothetical protein n=1 Tax=Winogradskyella eckloniae TaxID=1089306 RepID=UPI0015646E09|nr:hypothetical protein [Winogradskyella eckloniae]NRD21498.1 hypothetical protein [Winogradskyella eckloniae]